MLYSGPPLRRKPAVVRPPRQRPTRWVLRTETSTQAFTSLSRMAQSLTSHPIHDETHVVLERNGSLIYRGLWGGELYDAPTLL